MCVLQEFFWCEFFECCFDGLYVFVWCEFGVICDVEDMCVDCDCWLVECGVQYDVCCFVVDFWQVFECFVIGWYFVVVMFEQDLVCCDYVFCFGVIEVDCFDVFGDVFFVKCDDLLWGVCDWKYFLYCFVD